MIYTLNKDNIVPRDRYSRWQVLLRLGVDAEDGRFMHKGYIELWPFEKIYYYIQ